eukprot:5755028-Alexandrium_andersonii.AAC.1
MRGSSFAVGEGSENSGSRGAASADCGGHSLLELPILRQEPEMFDLATPPVPLSTSADVGGLEGGGHGAAHATVLPVADSWMSGGAIA